MLQHVLGCLTEWDYAWQIQYNVDSCEDIHIGRNKRKTDYYLNGCKFSSVDTKGDFGVFVHLSLKISVQV